MQYVCRSCILRLGQSCRTLAQPRPWLQPRPRLSGRMNHTSSLLGGQGSLSKHDKLHESHTNGEHEAEPFWPTGPAWPADSFPPTVPSKSNSEPERLAPDESRHPLEEEDWAADAADEALDNPNQEGTGHDEMQPAQQAPAYSSCQRAPVTLSPRDKAQLRIVRRTCRTEMTSFQKAKADFTGWKRLFKELSNPESQTPSLLELRMRNEILEANTVGSMRSLLKPRYHVGKVVTRTRFLLCTTLRHAPEKGIMLLQVLLSDSLPPFYVLEDSLGFLAHSLQQMELAKRQNCARKLVDTILQAFQVGHKGFIRLTQNTIYSIMDALSPPELRHWFEQLLAHEAPLHKNTLLQFARRFAKVPRTKDLSLEICQDLCGIDSLDINAPVGASLCTSLLTFKDNDLHGLDETLMTPAELFQCLLGLGLVPNVITYTCIIRSLCLKKDLSTAMEVFKVMRQHGVQPDEYTYSVMMNGCKSSGDFGTMLRFASDARAADFRDPVVWNDVIHAIFLACLKEASVSGGGHRARCLWAPMNAIYTRFFDPRPLRLLIPEKFTEVRLWLELRGCIPVSMQGAFREIPPLPPRDVIQPTSTTMGLMIMGFVRHLPRPSDVIHFYNNFKKLLEEGNPVAQSIVQEQGSIVHDIVLRALLKWRNALRFMQGIVRDMITDINPAAAAAIPLSPHELERQAGNIISTSNPGASTEEWPVNHTLSGTEAGIPNDAADATEPAGEAENGVWSTFKAISTNAVASHGKARPPIRHPRPSVYTWSILLKAFMSSRPTQEAEHILKLMQVHGVKPSIVTWNTLVAEYARLGKIKEAVEAMGRLEAAGFKSDDWTMRAFSYISNKAKAIRLMEQKLEENKMAQAAVEEMEQQQQQGIKAENDEVGPRGKMQANGLPDEYAQEPDMHGVVDQVPLPGSGSMQPGVQGSGGPTGEGQSAPGKATEAPRDEAQMPIAKAPVSTKADIDAWDAFLWDHAAEAEAEEEEKSEAQAA